MKEMIEINLDETDTEKFRNQMQFAEEIKAKKLAEWKEFTSLIESNQKAEILFGDNGEVMNMLNQVYMGKFLYDPQTIADSIDMILSVAGNSYNGNNEEAKEIYLNFEDFRIRSVYLFSIISNLKVFNAIGNEVINDYEQLKSVATDQDIWFMLDNAIRNANSEIELERQTAQNLQNAKALN